MKKINVLSLFDGISCAQLALSKTGIEVGSYYSSEVDKWASAITRYNYPDTIELGDVGNWREWGIDWSSVDLLIGGSPCTGFSALGKHMNFDDPQSKLFFDFVDILNHAKKHNPDIKFLLENVRMEAEWKDVISEYVGEQPVFINSSLVSAQSRQRLYWANWTFPQPKDCGVLLKGIIDGDFFVDREKSFCVTQESGRRDDSQKKRYITKSLSQYKWEIPPPKDKSEKLKMIDNMIPLSINETERLQTVDNDYTKYGMTNGGKIIEIPERKRFMALGNGFTVDVIAHILSYANFNGGENV